MAEQPLTQASSFSRLLSTVNKARAAGKGEKSGHRVLGGGGARGVVRYSRGGTGLPSPGRSADPGLLPSERTGAEVEKSQGPRPSGAHAGSAHADAGTRTRSLTRSALGASPVRTQARPGRKRQARVTPETPETDLGAAGRRGEAGGLGKDRRALLPRALRSHSPGHGC